MNPLAPPAPDPGPLTFDVSEADFQQSVLQRSMDVPVLLDCWAPWCGPCRGLTPVLEKLAQAYEGQFVLAKLNIDEAPQIAAALQARSIPLVVLFSGGRPVDQFAGALPEAQVRAFLDRHLAPPLAPAEALRQEAAEAEDAALAEQILHEALAHDAGNVAVKHDLAARLLDRG
ncbi:MAG: thioredoxin domain-containing protein, partial [Rubrivivax sp.]